MRNGNSECELQEFNKGRTSSNSKTLPSATYRAVSRQFISSKMKPTKASLDDDSGVGPQDVEGIRYLYGYF